MRHRNLTQMVNGVAGTDMRSQEERGTDRHLGQNEEGSHWKVQDLRKDAM